MGANANENRQSNITGDYLFEIITREQVIETECIQKILKMADNLHSDAVFAYNAYSMLQKLSECEQSGEKEMGLSPYLYHMLRKTNMDTIVQIITKAYKHRKNCNKEYSIDLLRGMCDEYIFLFSEMSARSGFLLQIPVPKLWVAIDKFFTGYYKGIIRENASDCSSSCVTLKGTYYSILSFMDFTACLLKDWRPQAMKYCDSIKVHYDRNENFHEEDPNWRRIEILIQYQLIFSGFIKNILSAKEKTVFASAADFDKMLQDIRQDVCRIIAQYAGEVAPTWGG